MDAAVGSRPSMPALHPSGFPEVDATRLFDRMDATKAGWPPQLVLGRPTGKRTGGKAQQGHAPMKRQVHAMTNRLKGTARKCTHVKRPTGNAFLLHATALHAATQDGAARFCGRSLQGHGSRGSCRGSAAAQGGSNEARIRRVGERAAELQGDEGAGGAAEAAGDLVEGPRRDVHAVHRHEHVLLPRARHEARGPAQRAGGSGLERG